MANKCLLITGLMVSIGKQHPECYKPTNQTEEAKATTMLVEIINITTSKTTEVDTTKIEEDTQAKIITMKAVILQRVFLNLNNKNSITTTSKKSQLMSLKEPK
jgi:hypothetical protein